MNVVARVELVEAQTGGWCEACALPSMVTVAFTVTSAFGCDMDSVTVCQTEGCEATT